MSDPIAALYMRIEELERRIANMIRVGNVSAVNKDGTVAVDDGTGPTDNLNWIEHGGEGGIKSRTMPVKGQQVMVLSPNGVPEIGWVKPAHFNDKNTMPDCDTATRLLSVMGVTFSCNGGKLTITGNVEIDGTFKSTGQTVLANGTVPVVFKGSVDTGGNTNDQGAAMVLIPSS